MTEYTLSITRRVLDPEYQQKYDKYVEDQQEQAKRREYRGYSSDYSDRVLSPPSAYLSESVLSVVVDEKTFEAVRKAALETL